jgi:hypothetical protein
MQPRFLTFLIAVFCLCAFGAGTASASPPAQPDPGAPGPYPATYEDYNFGLGSYYPPSLVSAITNQPLGPNELQGRVYYPQGLDDGTSPVPAGKMPLILFLHGRHGDAYNLTTGKSVNGWPPPAGAAEIPSYEGYDYAAELLASDGYVVISIGADGINYFDNSTADRGMLARAQLIQKSLDIMKVVTTTGGPPLGPNFTPTPVPPNYNPNPFGNKFVGKVDMTNIGIMGHSRGGEGVAAFYDYNQTQTDKYPINAVLAIAPVDYNRHQISGATYAVILPYCDGDVADNQGVHFFDDARYSDPGDPTPKFFWTVQGANHDYFNEIWTPNIFPYGASDDWLVGTTNAAVDPYAGPAIPGNHRLTYTQQEAVGAAYMTAFFRTYIGHESGFLPFMKGDTTPPASALTSELFETYLPPDNPTMRLDLNRFTSASDTTTDTAGGSVTATKLVTFQIVGGAPPNPTGGAYIGPPTSAIFALPGQPSARQPDNTPSLYHSELGGMSMAEVAWAGPGASLTDALKTPANVSGLAAIQFRAAVNFTSYLNNQAYDDLDVVLKDSAGHTASTPVSDYTKALMYPPGKIVRLPKVEMNAVRIPLSAFPGVDLTHVVSVSLVFDRQMMGDLLLSDMAFAN